MAFVRFARFSVAQLTAWEPSCATQPQLLGAGTVDMGLKSVIREDLGLGFTVWV